MEPIAAYRIWLFLLLVIAALGLLLRWRIGSRSRSWPEVEATVETHSREWKIDRHPPCWEAAIGFSYRVHGEYYAGYFCQGFGREEQADEFLASLPKGTKVVVRYDPKRPELSVLDDEATEMRSKAASHHLSPPA